MTSPLDRAVNPDEPSPYAPKWVRDAYAAKRKTAATGFENFEDKPVSPSGAPATGPDGGVVIERFRLPRSLEPTLVQAPGAESRSLARLLGSLALAIAVAAVAALVIVGKPWTSGVAKIGDDPNSFLPRFVGQTSASAERPSRPAPKLVAGQAAPRRTGEAFPLGVSVRGPREGALLLIGGLTNGATLSAGHPAGDNSWRVSTADLDDATIQPPRDFVGAMDLAIELRLADDTPTDRRSLRFEWAAPNIAMARSWYEKARQFGSADAPRRLEMLASRRE